MIPENSHFHKLCTAINEAINAAEPAFLSELNSVLERQGLQVAIAALNQKAALQAQQEKASLQAAEQALNNELLTLQEKIESYCSHQGILLPRGFMNPTDKNEFRSYELGILSSSRSKPYDLCEAVCNGLSFLLHIDFDSHVGFVSQEAYVDDRGKINGLHIDQLLQAYANEEQCFLRLAKHSFPAAMQRINRAIQVFKGYERLKEEAIKNKDVMVLWLLEVDFKKINGFEGVVALKKDCKKVFIAIEELAAQEDSEQQMPIHATARGCLIVRNPKNKKTRFSFEKRDGRLANYFFRNPGSEIDDRSLFSKIEGAPPEDCGEKEISEMREARKNVNKRYKQLGFPEYLVRTDNKRTKVNNKYRRCIVSG